MDIRALLYYGLPAVIGALCGFFLVWPVNFTLTIITLAIGIFALWKTYNWEIGSIYGMLVMFMALSFAVPLWIVYAIVVGATGGFSMSLGWMVR